MPDLQPYVPILLAALGVLVLIVVLILIYKLLNQRVRGRKGQRLGISEFHEIDKTRRIVLVRRDDVEHLVMIGGNQDLVIESNIDSGLMSGAQATPRSSQGDQVPMRQPKPAVFGSRRPILRSVEPSLENDDQDDGRA